MAFHAVEVEPLRHPRALRKTGCGQRRLGTSNVAKTNLSKLIEEACAGEEIVIVRGDNPVVRLAPVTPAPCGRARTGDAFSSRFRTRTSPRGNGDARLLIHTRGPAPRIYRS
jgi:antitoxin (DNA-binding transcriptional repressor) of toxin-antitoxin stability system